MFNTPPLSPELLASRQRAVVIIAGIGLAWLFYPILSMMVLPWITNEVVKLYVSRLIIWLMLPAIYYYSGYVEGRPFLPWAGDKQGPVFYVWAIPALFVLILIAGAIAAIPYRLFGLRDDFKVINHLHAVLKAHPILGFTMAFTAGVTEEVAFRGYVMPRLALLVKGKFWPVLISALLFAALHLTYHNFTELIFTTLFGIVVGWFYLQFRNLGVLVICHFAYDLIIIMLHK